MSAPSSIVLEDEPLIALDLEDTLQAAGFQSVTLLASCEDALEHISQHTPSLAIVDLHLKDGTSTDLCRELASRNVPIIVSSVSAQGDADAMFGNVVWLPKPISPADLLNSVAKALAVDGSRAKYVKATEGEAGAREVAAR
jgi:DNA-binding response OmpR family regulator